MTVLFGKNFNCCNSNCFTGLEVLKIGLMLKNFFSKIVKLLVKHKILFSTF